MGLFGKKEKNKENSITVAYFDGGLIGIECHAYCQLCIENDLLKILKVNSNLEIKLDLERITSIDIISENDYMMKYKGNSGVEKREIPLSYCVINYIDKEKNNKHIDFYASAMSINKIAKFRDLINSTKNISSYEI